MTIHMGAALRVLPKETVRLFRRSGAFIDGRWQEGGDTAEDEFRAVVQQAQPRDLRSLPAGADAQDAIVIHSPRELQTVDESRQRVADEIEVEGRGRYRIMSVGNWSGQGFRRYVAGSVQ